MKILNIVGMLVGSVACYVALAACGGNSQTAAAGTGGSGGTGASSGMPTTGTGNQSTGSASTGSGSCTCVAEPKKPEVVVEKCSHYFENKMSGTSQWYAEHAWPGASVEELGSVFTIVDATVGGLYLPAEYTKQVGSTAILADGKVAVGCTGQDKSVTFVRP